MLATSNQHDVEKMPYWLNVLVAIDQLGNALRAAIRTILSRAELDSSPPTTTRAKSRSIGKLWKGSLILRLSRSRVPTTATMPGKESQKKQIQK